MRLGVKTLILALVVALLAVPAAFAKGGHGGGKPSWAGAGDHGKPSWAGGGHGNGHAKADKAKADKGKAKKHERADAESELTPEDLEGLNPAWYCKALRSMMEDDDQSFYEHFGTNPNDANGFGMCVSERAQGGDPAAGVELSNDEAACAPADEGLSDEGTTEEGTSEDETLGEDVTTEEGDLTTDEGDELATEEGDDLTTDEGDDFTTDGDEECEAADDGASDDGASGDDSGDDLSGDDLSGDDLSGDDAGADETVAAFARALVSFIRV